MTGAEVRDKADAPVPDEAASARVEAQEPVVEDPAVSAAAAVRRRDHLGMGGWVGPV